MAVAQPIEASEYVQRLISVGYTQFVKTEDVYGSFRGRNYAVRGWAVDDGFEYEFLRRFPISATVLVYQNETAPPEGLFQFAVVM